MSVNANSSQLSEYLERLPGTTFRRLYQQPSTAFAIFRRMLPHLAKTIVMAMLYMPTPFLLSDLEIWVKPTAKRQKDQALSILRALHIIAVTVPCRETPQSMTLTANFKSSLRFALEGGGDHNSFGVPSQLPIAADVDIAFLDKYARKKWDDILHFVVNSVGLIDSRSDGSNGPKASVKDLLMAGRLVERKGASSTMNITQAGFTFLLQEANSQVWTLLLLWLEAADHANKEGHHTGMESVDMLSFLFLLASLELGRAYSTDALTEPRRNMIPYLVDFGLIYIPHHDRRQYFPTRLATTLTSSESSLRSVSAGFTAASEGMGGAQDSNAIILETNFRMYGYTSSPLQIAVLALFCDLKMRFQELVSGKLTRQSVRRAVDMGITADQIISYLATHAHEQMHRVAASAKKSLLPTVIVDQIRLWQLDTERMATTNGFLFKEFDDYKEYISVVTFADEIGVLQWRNDRKGMFFITYAGLSQVKDFVKNKNKEKKAGK
ncbi:transcription factor Tfb2-domain-containing protein [Pseudomassariella vexata]|uniref:RNA polymerase II transcription factor B subunit 2 n=1 Tax=Pseudomassariella vexata TaxID=1141098 RepID=A0A1Y2DQU3_9PEZI|nr:transcription factor Tfb2-domain-containing protein [Pseudomassariella vexata]ORY61640.1 transcription factor Tfb2-domain-containing protein [Pseudomassariella vexata]